MIIDYEFVKQNHMIEVYLFYFALYLYRVNEIRR